VPASGRPAPGNAQHAPLRDVLLLLTWMTAFLGSTVQWRERTVQVQDDPAGPMS